MAQPVPAVRVVGIEGDGLAVGPERFVRIVQKGQRADVAGGGAGFLVGSVSVGLASFQDALEQRLGLRGIAGFQCAQRGVEARFVRLPGQRLDGGAERLDGLVAFA